MRTIADIQDTLGTSKMVFKANLRDNDTIRFELVDTYKPIVTSDDPIEKLVVVHYSEYFDRDRMAMVKKDTTSSVMDSIRERIRSLYSAQSKLKNPSASKMYKFLYRYPFNEATAISLYRYLAPFTTNDSFLPEYKESVHAKNFMLILEKLKETHEKQR